MKLHPAAFSSDVDLAVSAYTWTPTGHFLIATRQATLCALDGTSGAVLHMCAVDQPITSLSVAQGFILMTHEGHDLEVWTFESKRLPSGDVPLGELPTVSIHS